MRIRKLIARLILGVPTSPSRPPSPPRSSTMDPYVCQLNQSLWDIYAYPSSPPSSATNDYAGVPVDRELDESFFLQDENSIENPVSSMVGQIKMESEVNGKTSMYSTASQKNESDINVEESMFSMASQKDELDINVNESLYSMVLRRKDESEINEVEESMSSMASKIKAEFDMNGGEYYQPEREDCDDKYADVRTGNRSKRKKMETNMDMDTEADRTAPIVAGITCNRTDGKNWNCKRPAYYPHKLCFHHLSQNRAYGSGATTCNVNQVPAITATNSHAAKRARISAKSAGSSSDYYYYYSGFGPWRGKQRGVREAPSTAVMQEEKKEETENWTNYQGNKVVGNEDKKKEKQISTPNSNRRKNGKVRSLKSFSGSF